VRILLVDVDSKIPNIALGKLSTYYKSKGHEVDYRNLGFKGIFHKKERKITIDANPFDKVFVSNIFVKNRKLFKVVNCDKVKIGGVGSDFPMQRLPKKIDRLEIDYSLWPENDTSWGFITRGCIRKCSFCFVPKTEGMLYYYMHPKKIIKHDKVDFMDNNIMAYKHHKKVFKWLINHEVKLNFNQGLDVRLLDEENCKLLSEMKFFKKRTFAFDDINYKKMIEKKLPLIKKYFPEKDKIRFFIYTSAENPVKDAVERIMWCKEHRFLGYVMRDQNCYTSDKHRFFAKMTNYCNFPANLFSCTFEDYIKGSVKNRRVAKECIDLWNGNITEVKRNKVKKEWWK